MSVMLVMCSFNGFDKLRLEYFLPAADDTSSSVIGGTGATYYTSHLRTRTKQELKSTEKMLLGCASTPDLWAKYVVLLFLHSFVSLAEPFYVRN